MVGGKEKRSRKTQRKRETANGKKSLKFQVDLYILVMSSHVELLQRVEKEATLWFSPEAHGTPGCRLFEPRSSENSPGIQTATVLQDKHEVSCSEWENNYNLKPYQCLLMYLHSPILQLTTCFTRRWITFEKAEIFLGAEILFDFNASAHRCWRQTGRLHPRDRSVRQCLLNILRLVGVTKQTLSTAVATPTNCWWHQRANARLIC